MKRMLSIMMCEKTNYFFRTLFFKILNYDWTFFIFCDPFWDGRLTDCGFLISHRSNMVVQNSRKCHTSTRQGISLPLPSGSLAGHALTILHM